MSNRAHGVKLPADQLASGPGLAVNRPPRFCYDPGPLQQVLNTGDYSGSIVAQTGGLARSSGGAEGAERAALGLSRKVVLKVAKVMRS